MCFIATKAKINPFHFKISLSKSALAGTCLGRTSLVVLKGHFKVLWATIIASPVTFLLRYVMLRDSGYVFNVPMALVVPAMIFTVMVAVLVPVKLPL